MLTSTQQELASLLVKMVNGSLRPLGYEPNAL